MKPLNFLFLFCIFLLGFFSASFVYFITKGDKNPVDDGKIRFEQIEYKTIGVIW